MDEEEDMDIAAAMGFGSFGGTKKRKHDQTQSPRATADDASGANSTQLGVRPNKSASTQEAVPEDAKSSDSKGYLAANDASAMETVSFGGPPVTKKELNALKFGVKNEKGDIAYFLPNFVEDPWASLKTTGA